MENKIHLLSEYSYQDIEESQLLNDSKKIEAVKAIKLHLSNLFEKKIADPELIRILRYYFNLDNERKASERPNAKALEYLTVLCMELYNILKEESYKPVELPIFRLFVHLNFNKDQIIRFYLDKVDLLIENNNQDLLNAYYIESKYQTKKSIAFTKKNHELGKVIRKHIKVVLQQHERMHKQKMIAIYGSTPLIPQLFTVKES